jgi:hypothetical protein
MTSKNYSRASSHDRQSFFLFMHGYNIHFRKWALAEPSNPTARHSLEKEIWIPGKTIPTKSAGYVWRRADYVYMDKDSFGNMNGFPKAGLSYHSYKKTLPVDAIALCVRQCGVVQQQPLRTASQAMLTGHSGRLMFATNQGKEQKNTFKQKKEQCSPCLCFTDERL